MAKETHNMMFEEDLLDELADELLSVSNEDLDSLLVSVGFDPALLLKISDNAYAAATLGQKRRRFELAREYIRNQRSTVSVISNLDDARKRKIVDMVRSRSEASADITMAARNQDLSSAEDLNAMLTAWVRLGLIDDEGNLKD